jgi:2-oxoglutarate ferredoxin oxidoreductase subunit beta
MPIGVYRDIEAPSMETAIWDQIHAVQKTRGTGDLASLLVAGDTWEVKG